MSEVFWNPFAYLLVKQDVAEAPDSGDERRRARPVEEDVLSLQSPALALLHELGH